MHLKAKYTNYILLYMVDNYSRCCYLYCT